MELQEAFDQGFAAVKAYVDDSFSAFEKRLADLEARAPEKGEKGDPGERGEPGIAGDRGPIGERGEPGQPGEKGERGDKGDVGPQGERGPAGENGKDGSPGRDGRDGLPGVQGEKGRDGIDGKDGKDGLGFDDVQIEFDGERGLKFTLVSGDRRKDLGSITLPAIIYRGVWAEREFKKGDAVTWGGSLFIANEDTTDKPETSRAWQLAVKRGQNGKDGVMKAAPEVKPVRV